MLIIQGILTNGLNMIKHDEAQVEALQNSNILLFALPT